MKVFKSITAFLASLFLLGTALTLFLTILTGATEKSILKKFYWLEVDCSDFPGAPISSDRCRWTNYGLCGVSNNENSDCTHDVAAYPFAPSRNFNSDENLPDAFVNNDNYYYYTSRIGYGFSLVGIAFLVFSFLPFFIILFSNAWYKGFKTIFWILYSSALLFIIVGIALSTTAYAKGRNHFRDAGYTANLGTKAMSTAWTTFFLMLFNIPFIAYATSQSSGSSSPSSFSRFNFKKNKSMQPASNSNSRFNGGWFKRKDIPPSNQVVYSQDQQMQQVQNDGTITSNANYLSFTPVKETKATSVDLENNVHNEYTTTH